jgi:hypothetical protein
MTAIQRIQITAALNQLEIADKWLGQVATARTRESLGIAMECLQTALAGTSLNDSLSEEVTDADLPKAEQCRRSTLAQLWRTYQPRP